MRHFQVTEWADYVRQLCSPDLREQMSAHLESGCAKCTQMHDLLSRFAAVCLRERAYEIPADAERLVKAMAHENKAARQPLLGRLWAVLVRDGVTDPLPVGVRGGHQIDRHAIFQAGDYSVDLRFEHEKGSATVVLVGQISNRKAPQDMLANVPVILVAGTASEPKERARSMSNSFGEFQVEYIPEQDLRLLVPLESRNIELAVSLGRAE